MRERTSSGLALRVIDLVEPWREVHDTVMFHHGIGVTQNVWQRWIPVLAPHFRIVTFDMRGFGTSRDAATRFDWTLDNLASDILEVMDHVSVERVHLIGESMGGTIALAFALDHGSRVRSLTISNGAHVGGSIRNVDRWRETLANEGPEKWSLEFMANRFFDDALSSSEWRWFHGEQSSQPADSIVNALSVLVGTELTPRLGSLDLPTLLLHGDSSPFIPVGIMADLHAALRSSELRIFPHARHGLPFSHGTECASAFLDFFRRNGFLGET